ncbi:uncharacterized protein LOC125509284 isoform X2 [Triticum urartu]|uniref:uncharacterized protein LOC125509284 isoform X2 n=1 Tax=Triticum urartu TaxID=4572 RepID=UPI0020433F88|nr:uncharacterized protein LOC125509284 isoform X2 [Triticum urartu]
MLAWEMHRAELEAKYPLSRGGGGVGITNQSGRDKNRVVTAEAVDLIQQPVPSVKAEHTGDRVLFEPPMAGTAPVGILTGHVHNDVSTGHDPTPRVADTDDAYALRLQAEEYVVDITSTVANAGGLEQNANVLSEQIESPIHNNEYEGEEPFIDDSTSGDAFGSYSDSPSRGDDFDWDAYVEDLESNLQHEQTQQETADHRLAENLQALYEGNGIVAVGSSPSDGQSIIEHEGAGDGTKTNEEERHNNMNNSSIPMSSTPVPGGATHDVVPTISPEYVLERSAEENRASYLPRRMVTFDEHLEHTHQQRRGTGDEAIANDGGVLLLGRHTTHHAALARNVIPSVRERGESSAGPMHHQPRRWDDGVQAMNAELNRGQDPPNVRIQWGERFPRHVGLSHDEPPPQSVLRFYDEMLTGSDMNLSRKWFRHFVFRVAVMSGHDIQQEFRHGGKISRVGWRCIYKMLLEKERRMYKDWLDRWRVFFDPVFADELLNHEFDIDLDLIREMLSQNHVGCRADWAKMVSCPIFITSYFAYSLSCHVPLLCKNDSTERNSTPMQFMFPVWLARTWSLYVLDIDHKKILVMDPMETMSGNMKLKHEESAKLFLKGFCWENSGIYIVHYLRDYNGLYIRTLTNGELEYLRKKLAYEIVAMRGNKGDFPDFMYLEILE